MEDQNSFVYKPDGKTAAPTPAVPAVATAKTAAATPTSAPVSWQASEFIDHARGASWYLGLIGLTLLSAGVIYLITKEYFATGIVVVLGIVVAIASTHKPRQLTYSVSGTGISVGEKSHAFRDFKSFSVIHESGLASINLIPLKRIMPPLTIYMDPADEAKVTAIIGEHLPYEDGQMDGVERLARRLRF